MAFLNLSNRSWIFLIIVAAVIVVLILALTVFGDSGKYETSDVTLSFDELDFKVGDIVTVAADKIPSKGDYILITSTKFAKVCATPQKISDESSLPHVAKVTAAKDGNYRMEADVLVCENGKQISLAQLSGDDLDFKGTITKVTK